MAFEDLEIAEFPDALGPDHFHFLAVKPSFHGQQLRGFGSAHDRNLALQKAVGELIERAAFYTDSGNGASRSSSGYASHESEAQARENATAELIERDIVLCHWLHRHAPFWLAEEDLPADVRETLRDLNGRVRPMGYELTLGILGQAGEIAVPCGLVRSPAGKIGFTFSSSASREPARALLSVISDMRRNVTILWTRERDGEALFQKMDAAGITEPDHHREYYLDPAHSAGLDWFFAGSSEVLAYEMPEVRVQSLPIPIEVGWKCHAMRASSEALQAYFVGPTEMRWLNVARLGGEELVAGLNLMPHPLP